MHGIHADVGQLQHPDPLGNHPSGRTGDVTRSTQLPSGNGLRISRRKAFSAIVRDRPINNGTTVDALPCIENEKEIRKPFQHHQPFALRTFHYSLPRWLCSQLMAYIAKDAPNLHILYFQILMCT